MAVPAETAKKVDITQHILVPKHSILTQEEITEVLEQFNISVMQLPVIFSNDPIAKTLGAKPGNVVKVERTGPTGKSAYYRRVV